MSTTTESSAEAEAWVRRPRDARRKRTKEEKAARAAARRKRHRRRAPWVRAGWWLVARLPLLPAAWLGDLLGLGVYLFSTKARSRCLTHVEMAFGDEKTPRERRRIVRTSLRQLGRGLTTLLVMHRMGVEATMARISSENEDVARRAIAEHGSCLLAGGHFGLLEMSAFYAGHSLNARTVAADTREDTLAGRLQQIRDDLEVGVVPRGDPRELMRAIKDGRPVGIAIDHDVPAIRGVFLPFFGRPSHTVVGPGSIAVRHRIPLVFTRVQWDGWTRHKIVFGPVLHPRDDLPKNEAAIELMARATAEIERQIRARPADWMWLHRRWGTTPELFPDREVWTPEETA